MQRFFYRKADKLKSRKAIDELFSKGLRFSVFPFHVIWLPKNEQANLQTGIGVSSRFFKKATDRNRIKRLMRESYRLQKNELQQQLKEKESRLSVFILYTGKELPDQALVHEKMALILKNLIKQTDGKNQATA